jgi:microcystin-dependent protein
MLLLVSTTDKVQVVTGSAGAIDVHASWMDNVSGAVQPGRTNTNIATAATTDVVAPPASGVQRNIKTLHIRNRGTGSNAVTVQHTDGVLVSQLTKVTLAPEQTLQYIDEIGFIPVQGSASTGPNAFFTTGDAKLTFKNVADPGWVIMNDGSIGDPLSGASTRAHDDCNALFLLLWANLNDIAAPVSGSRGLSAAADWTAHKRITLPRNLGRALAVAGAGAGLTGRGLGGYLGEESHTPTAAEMWYHSHGISFSDPGHTHGMPRRLTESEPFDRHFADDGGSGYSLDAQLDYAGTGISLGIGAAGGNVPFNVMQPSAFWNVMLKL